MTLCEAHTFIESVKFVMRGEVGRSSSAFRPEHTLTFYCFDLCEVQKYSQYIAECSVQLNGIVNLHFLVSFTFVLNDQKSRIWPQQYQDLSHIP